MPYKKIGIDFPARRQITIWKKEGGNHRSVHRAPAIFRHDINKRPIFMVPTFASLRRMDIRDENPRVNLVVMKPMANKRAFT